MEYKDTLNLPKTEFAMKGNLPVREPIQIKAWEDANIYARMLDKNSGGKSYVFHDGPPYANGHLHLGTVLNKTLKDIVVKYRNMSGYRCEFIPGWDCHGLPIELEVEKKLGAKKCSIEPIEVRKACRVHAEKYMSIQREEFKRMGVFAKWSEPYLTMSFDYEASIAREFGRFVKAGSLYKGKRPIYWCASCETALAEAEVEYKDHKSSSIYVKFKLMDDTNYRKLWGLKSSEDIFLVIWTTTPWTIPANLAIALNPELDYVAARVDGEVWIMAEGLIENVMSAVGKSYSEIVGKPDVKNMDRMYCKHPIIDRDSIIVLGDHVTLEAGTGAVHTAPGHGQDDFDVGKEYGLDAFAPIDDAGKFTQEVGLSWLEGVFVGDANKLIIDELNRVGALVYVGETSHSYPHCWRCKKPIVFRVTDQWFISVEKNDLREKALSAIENVKWIPAWGKQRISSMMAVRPDWCISRQRLWGVPIIALVCEKCGTSHTTTELVENVANIFEREGADAWFTRSISDFKPNGFKCPSCGNDLSFKKEDDILDVWFDSGVSFAAVLENRLKITEPADLYLEGSDQHRGWFHTSLLASIGTRGRAPYKNVLTHGFVVDGKGKKYSKSAKNYIPPEKTINRYGAEILRLWVASEDYKDDIRFSDEILKRCIEAYRKLRNTARYILGNIGDFNPDSDSVPYDKMEEIDRFALAELGVLNNRILKAYDDFDFHMIFHTLNRFCAVEMSSFYLDILKDRLYTEKADGHLRRSAQTVLWTIIDVMAKLMAPVFSFTAEEIWQVMPHKSKKMDSVFLSDMPSVSKVDSELLKKWEKFMQIRTVALKALEDARADKFVGNSLAASLNIECDDDTQKFLEGFGIEALADLFIVSDVQFKTFNSKYVAESDDDSSFKVKIGVEKAKGGKCERCWKYSPSVGKNSKYPEICNRCVEVLG